MKTMTRPALTMRPASYLLLAGALLLGLLAGETAHAQQKKDLIEVPMIKKFKEEKAAAAAEAAAESAHKPAAVKAPASEEGMAATKGANPKHAGEKATAADEHAVTPSASSVQQLRQALTAIGTPSTRPVEKRAGAAHSVRAHAPAKTQAEATPKEHGTEGHSGEAHWTYEGENGPPAWGTLKPEFNLCALGKRQSPIAIQSNATLQGPAEPIDFAYTPSAGTVVNNGHTIQVDVQGENSIMVRNSTYKLLQFHFHTPSEEMINTKRYAMVAHLVHKNAVGQLAVVSVLMEVGEPSSFLDKVWTYMPLDTNDRVRMPDNLVDMNEILPADQRYYQYFGSLTTPPCSEGVLWLVIKQPLRISPAQYKLFSQQFPFNARPVQAVNGRLIREAK
jgi:carbonic anhydrase